MRMILSALAVSAALIAADAAAQMMVLNLTGRYRCVAMCQSDEPGVYAFITQNGLELNIVDEVGTPTRAWIDYPGHIWVDRQQQGALYSPDGLMIQFDRGTVWQRDTGEAAPVRRERGKRQEGRRVVGAPTAYDGDWNVVLLTQNGPCNPEYRFATQISNGAVLYSSGGINLQGTVAPNGAVAVSISAGRQYAQGEGVLSFNSGSGTWRGQGNAGVCVGTWQASRLS